MPIRDWAKIRQTLISIYNTKVIEKFGTTPSVEQQARLELLKIQSNDSALIAQSRIELFNLLFPAEYYAAVPEWWQVRLEANRPQMIFMFAEKLGTNNFDSAKYPITVPHPTASHYQTSPLPDYQKGQYEGILTLKDNSKVIINAISPEEADKVLKACKAIIIAEFLVGATQKIGPRSGVELLKINVSAKHVNYFSSGLKNTKPDWIDYF